MESREKQERRNGPKKKKSGGCVIIAVILAALAIPAVLVCAFFMYFWARKATVMEHAAEEIARAEATYMDSQATLMGDGENKGLVILTEELIGSLSATDFGDELSREHFIAVVADDDATDLMRKQLVEKANGTRVKWLLRVGDISAPDSDGAIKASLNIPYRIPIGTNGWSGSSVSVRAEFGPDAVDDLLKVRRGEWVNVEGELKLESNGRNPRILGARVVKPSGTPAERER